VTVDRIRICHSIYLIYIAHVAVIIRQFAALWPSRYNHRNYFLLMRRGCLSKYVHRVCPSTVFFSSHPQSVPEGHPVGGSFAWGRSPVACPSCWVGQCHSSKFVSWPSNRISLGMRSNCPYTVFGHVLVFCQFRQCHVSCGQVLHGALSVSAQINCHIIRVSSLITHPSFVFNNTFVNGQMFRRVVKF